MTESRAHLERLKTGITGLDTILEGGLPRGGVYLIEGPPGSGKTILGNQVCFNHVATGGTALYVTLLAESHARMIAHLGRMRFFDSAAVPERLSYVSAFQILEAAGLDGLLRLLRTELGRTRASLLVLDGFVTAEEASRSDTDFKRFIHALQTIAGMHECTVLLLSSARSAAREHTVLPEHTIVDGVIRLKHELDRLRSIRQIVIVKLRGAAPIHGQHTLQISDEGISVQPRLEARVRTATPPPPKVHHASERAAFGVPSLDEMLHGGLRRPSLTMLLGPSGSGKTILGLQFLAEGARQGERSVYFGLYEQPEALLLKSARIRLNIEDPVERGLLVLEHHTPVEGLVDVIGEQLLATVARTGAQRLCIDGFQGLEMMADYPSRRRDMLSAVANELEDRGVTTVFTMETTDLFGPRIEVPVAGLSAMTQNILLLRHVELRARLYRLISIIKLRDSDYEPTIREFRITDHGIVVADTFKSAERILGGVAHVTTPAPRPRPRSGAARATPVRGRGKRKS